MKTTVTIIGLIMLMSFFSAPAMAVVGQKGLGGALELAFPTGSFGDVAGTGIGITANFQYGWKPNIDLMAQLGFIRWGGKTNGANWDYSYHALPIQVGGKYFFNEETNRFYVGGLVGFHLFRWSFSYDRPYPYGHYSASSSKTEFSIAPMGGYEMKIGESMMFDASARYQIVSDNLSYFGIRAGLIFNLR
jgi:opacity protein-like surface antigen